MNGVMRVSRDLLPNDDIEKPMNRFAICGDPPAKKGQGSQR
jgi:hypothetical protein